MSGKGNEAYEKFDREMGAKYGHLMQKVDPTAPVREFALAPEQPAVTPHEAGARALWQAEHPGVNPDVWGMLNAETRAAWVEKARPVVDAAAAEAWSEGRLAGLICMEYYCGPISNPYRVP